MSEVKNALLSLAVGVGVGFPVVGGAAYFLTRNKPPEAVVVAPSATEAPKASAAYEDVGNPHGEDYDTEYSESDPSEPKQAALAETQAPAPVASDNTDLDIDKETDVRFRPAHPLRVEMGKAGRLGIKYGTSSFYLGEPYKKFVGLFGQSNYSDYLFRTYGDLGVALHLDYDNHDVVESCLIFMKDYQGTTTPGGWDFAFKAANTSLEVPLRSRTPEGVEAVWGAQDFGLREEAWGSGHVRRQIEKKSYKSGNGDVMFVFEDGELAYLWLSIED